MKSRNEKIGERELQREKINFISLLRKGKLERWQKNLIVLWVAMFLVQGAMSLIMPFLPFYIEKDMGITDVKQVTFWAGLIFGANFLAAAFFAPMWGRLADKHGRKIMVLRSGFGMAIIISAMGLATNVYQLLFLRFLNGTISGFIPASIALTATNTPKDKSGYALGTLQASGVAGGIIGPFIGGALAKIIGYREIFFITGFSLFVAALAVLLFVKEEFKKPLEEKIKGNMRTDMKTILKTQPLATLFIVAFLIQFAMFSITPILPMFIKSITSPLNAAFFAGLISSVTGFANMLSSPRLGKLGDKYGSEKVLFYSTLLAGLLFIPQALSTSIWVLMFWRFLLGLTIGGMLPSVQNLIRHFAPRGKESSTYGLNTSAQFIGNLLGPISGGFLAGFIGLNGVLLMTGTLLIITSLWVKVVVTPKIDLQKTIAN